MIFLKRKKEFVSRAVTFLLQGLKQSFVIVTKNKLLSHSTIIFSRKETVSEQGKNIAFLMDWLTTGILNYGSICMNF